MTKPYHLRLKAEPDGLGYLYGTLSDDAGNAYRVNIMPPLSGWRGSIKPDGESAPHATDWVVYVDGCEFARVKKRDDVEGELVRRLSTH